MTTETRRERWLAIRATPRHRVGVLIAWRPSPPPRKRPTTVQQRRDSTRAKRARRDREAMTP